MYKVNYEAKALKQLKKMDRFQAKIIVDWVEKNLVDTEDPRRIGKALGGNRSGEWRYRVGDFRLLAEIVDEKIVIHIIKIGHRRDVYES